MKRVIVLLLATTGLGLAVVSCSESKKRSFASTTAPTTSSNPAGTTTSTGSTSQVADITSLQIGGPLVSGDVPLAYRVSDPSSAPADVAISFSLDGGQTWQGTSPVSSSASTTQVTTAPAPGLEHTYLWDSATDIPAFEPSVLLKVEAVGGGSLTSGTLAVDNQAVSTHVTLNRLPFLQLTRTDSTIIAWRTDQPTDTVVEYGDTPALGQTVTGAGPSQAHDVTLGSLQPGTRYYYRIVDNNLPITPRYSFETAPPASSTDFSFVVVGDSGMNNPEQFQVANLMAQEDADFFLHTGDVVYPIGGFGAAVSEYNARFFGPYGDMLTRIPAFPVVGNHDMYGLLGQPFKDTFFLPSNGFSLFDELYYAFEWGDAKFIAIESNTLWRVNFGPHVSWLQNEINTNTKKWLIVYMHTPLYSAGHHGDNTTLQNHLGSLFEHGKVDVVLTGHDHNYERTKPIKQFNTDPSYPGLVHIVTGGGGANLRPMTANANTDVAVVAHHYLKVRINGDWLEGTATDINGQTIDTFRIRDQ